MLTDNDKKYIAIHNCTGSVYVSGIQDEDGNNVFPLTDSCERNASLMGDDYVRLVFNLNKKVVFEAYSYIEYNGQTFFLRESYSPIAQGTIVENNQPSSLVYKYDFKFVSVGNMLSKYTCYRYVHVNDGGVLSDWDEPEINVSANLETMYSIIITSISRAASRTRNSHFKDLLNTLVTNCWNAQTNKPTDYPRITTGDELETYSFSSQNIQSVLSSVCKTLTDKEHDTEWWITENEFEGVNGLVLHMAKCQDETNDQQINLSDEFIANTGSDKCYKPYLSNGLVSCKYEKEVSDIPQILTPYGSTRNMSKLWTTCTDLVTNMMVTYGKRLRLDANTQYTVYKKADKEEQSNPYTIETDKHGSIKNNFVDTGIEKTSFYEDIYPQCHFQITSVVVKNKKVSGVDYEVPEYTCEAVVCDSKNYEEYGKQFTNEELVEMGFFPLSIETGQTLSVRFESGFLNGREFEVSNKTHKDQTQEGEKATYSLKFTIVSTGSAEDGNLVPSGNFIPKEGDQFALFNMKMPLGFVTLAKKQLAQKAFEELVNLQETKPAIKCKSEQNYFEDKSIDMWFGRMVKVHSESLGKESENTILSRCTAYQYKMTNPYSVDFTLASAIVTGVISSMQSDIADAVVAQGGINQRTINLSRRGWHDAAETADMLDSITSEMMLVGNAQNQFGFTFGIEISEAHNDNALVFSYGELQHTQDPYISNDYKGLWYMNPQTKMIPNADNDTPYYVFAECRDDNQYITPIILPQDDEDAKSYIEETTEMASPHHFLLGTLSSKFETKRVFNRTNGFTSVAGGTITTEQIQDAGRNLIIDFQHNKPRIIARNGAEIIGKIRFTTLVDGEGNDYPEKVKTETENYVSAIKNQLQEQIDGVVDSYFLKGTPPEFVYNETTSSYETPSVDKDPIFDWVSEYAKEAGEGWSEMGEDKQIVLLNRHLGDTYTNINSYKKFPNVEWEMLFVNNNKDKKGRTYDALKRTNEDENNCIRTKTLFSIADLNGYVVKFADSYIDASKYIIYVLHFGYSSGKYVYLGTYDKGSNGNGVTLRNKNGDGNTIDMVAIALQNTSNPKEVITTRVAENLDNEIKDETAGRSWRFCKDEGSYHWHEIADSDAIKALQEAAKARDVADGKRRVFSSQPIPPYDVRDLWSVSKTYGTTDDEKKIRGELMICTQSRAYGSFVRSDWELATKYTDDTYAESVEEEMYIALEVANAAANDANNKITNITDDGIISGGTEKYTVRKEWEEIAGEDGDGKGGSYFKAKKSAIEYLLDQTEEGTKALAELDNCFNELKSVLDEVFKEMNEDYTLDGENARENFNRLWSDYYMAEVSIYNIIYNTINKNADDANEKAQAALDNIESITNDNIISAGTEKESIRREWQAIAGVNGSGGSYKIAISQADNYKKDGSYLGGIGNYVTALNTAYTNLSKGVADVLKDDDDYDFKTDDARKAFNALWRNYYDAEVSLYNAIANYLKGSLDETKTYIDNVISGFKEQIDGLVNSYFYDDVPRNIVASGDKISEPKTLPMSDWVDEYVQEKEKSWSTLTRDEQNLLFERHKGDTYTSILDAEVDIARMKDNIPFWFEKGSYVTFSDEYDYTNLYKDDADYVKKKFIRSRCLFHTKELYIKKDSYEDSEGYGLVAFFQMYSSNFKKTLRTWDRTITKSLAEEYPFFGIVLYREKVVGMQYIFKDISFSDIIDNDNNLLIDICASSNDQTRLMLANATAGKSWRFLGSDNDVSLYHWHEIEDGDILNALQKASEAKDTADGKRRVFSTQPYVPYDIGDLWAEGENGDLLICITTRGKNESFNRDDWKNASKYTDDTTANEAKDIANNAKKAIENVTDDGIISGGTEKQTVRKEWIQIAGATMDGIGNDGSYKSTYNECGKYLLSNLQNEIKSAFNELKGIVDKVKLEDTDIQKDCVLSEIGTTRDAFNALWAKYYDIENSARKAISEVINTNALETEGGENLYGGSESFKIDALDNDNNYRILVGKHVNYFEAENSDYLENGKKYVFSAESITAEVNFVTVGIYEFDPPVGQPSRGSFKNISVGGNVSATFEVPEEGNYSFIAYAGIRGRTSRESATYKKVMVQLGDRPSTYSPYTKYLRKAFAGSTEIEGGVVMTNVVAVKNTNIVADEKEESIVAGMNGLIVGQESKSPFIWGGGTYQDAVDAAQSTDYKKSSDGQPITTLIKHDGTGKIGCFKVLDKDTICVENNGKRLYITNRDVEDFVKIQSSVSLSSTYSDDFEIDVPTKKNVPKSNTETGSGTIFFLLSSSYFESLKNGNYNIRYKGCTITLETSAYGSTPSSNFSYSNIRFAITKDGKEIYTKSIMQGSDSVSVSINEGSKTKEVTFSGLSDSIKIEESGSYKIGIFIDYEYRIANSSIDNNRGSVLVSIDDDNERGRIVYAESVSVYGKNGFAVSSNSDCTFISHNTGEDLDIIVSGLPSSASTPGQLYDNGDGIIRVVH